MRAVPTEVAGVMIVESQIFPDDRGSFTTVFDAREFATLGLDMNVVETHLARNSRAGTLRGLHFQQTPSGQAKLVRCVRGQLYDVALDLRPESATYLMWTGTVLAEGDGRGLYIPVGCAHGYLTLRDHTDVQYHVNAPYDPGRARGVRWDDPAFGIEWPSRPQVLTDRDANYPDYHS